MSTTSKRVVRIGAAILLGMLAGTLSLWLLGGREARELEALRKQALCVLELPAGVSTASATFTNVRSIERFQVGLETKARHERWSISISGERGLVGSASGIKSGSFGLGRDVAPGKYAVTVGQEAPGQGGRLAVADATPVYLTGWQIWSCGYVGLLMLAGAFVVLLRKTESTKMRASALAAFHYLLLGFVLLFIYLLFHEGGHALAQLAFGRFDLARSDFWGIHGHPHSGGGSGPPLQPWQQTMISCAGPMLPTFAGFGLFLLWILPPGRKLRNRGPLLSLYFSAMVAMLVFPEAVCGPAYLVGIITAEGDLVGSVARSGGPAWLATGLVVAMFLLSVLILWRVGPEIWKTWKMQTGISPTTVSPPPANRT